MKKNVRLWLTLIPCLILTACKTTQQTSRSHEEKAVVKERTDTFIERDSVLILVHQKMDTVEIVRREVRERERVKVQRDTVTVVKTDTVKITETKIRSPAKKRPTLKTWIYAAFTAFVIFSIISIIIKIKKLCHRLI